MQTHAEKIKHILIVPPAISLKRQAFSQSIKIFIRTDIDTYREISQQISIETEQQFSCKEYTVGEITGLFRKRRSQ